MLLGDKDDWAPPQRCVQLAERTRASQPTADFTVKVYPDSHHGFDSARPVRFRTDVPNGVDRSGVHVGGNPVAREQSRRELDLFLARIFK
jgi:dienelactone hydrolase